jgi:hypothetical protein
MNSIPIIIISFGNPWYLKFILSQAKYTNPKSRIILLGDKSNIGYLDIEHYCFDDFNANINKLNEAYVHLSSNPYKFELFCIQRWIYLYNFLSKKNIQECFVMDSDILLYESIEKYSHHIPDNKLSLYFEENSSKLSASAGNIFIKNNSTLNDFIDYIFSLYSNQNSDDFNILKKHFQDLVELNQNGGVCDMSLFYMYYLKNEQLFFNLFDFHTDFIMDDSLNSASYGKLTFEMDQGIKKIKWKSKTPYFILKEPNGKQIKSPLLHFQGDLKKIIPNFTNKRNRYFFYNFYWISFKNWINGKVIEYKRNFEHTNSKSE